MYSYTFISSQPPTHPPIHPSIFAPSVHIPIEIYLILMKKKHQITINILKVSIKSIKSSLNHPHSICPTSVFFRRSRLSWLQVPPMWPARRLLLVLRLRWPKHLLPLRGLLRSLWWRLFPLLLGFVALWSWEYLTYFFKGILFGNSRFEALFSLVEGCSHGLRLRMQLWGWRRNRL